MSLKTVRLPEGWEPFEKASKIIGEKGAARVYFASVSCSGRPAGREARKLEKWTQGKPAKLVWLEDTLYDSRGNRSYWKPAVRMDVRTPAEFAEAWWELQAIPNSSCGCSVMVNDAQGTDVRVMDTEHVAYGERAY